MFTTAPSRARHLKRLTGYRGWAGYASTALATKSSSGGLFSWLIGEKSSSLSSLDFPLEGVTHPSPLPDYVEPGTFRTTTLPNGLIIASETSATPVASVGLHVDCGSIYETSASFGATHLLERMAFKSTTNRSHLRVVREVEAVGGNVSASGSREHISYTYDALKTYVPHMVELLVDSVRNPAFLDWEVSEQLHKMRDDISELSKNPESVLSEAIHSTGYSGPYANSLLASESAVNHLNSTVLEEFVSENYTASRMVLAASGIDHDKLVEYAEPLLSDLPNVSRPSVPKPIYTGGDFRRQADTEDTHFAIAFEFPGGWINIKDSVTLIVLQFLLGGGGSFSTGGPGKGMHSRLYNRVLNRHIEIRSINAISSIFNHSGLFGILAASDSAFALHALDKACKELLAVATPGEVDNIQLDRAKLCTKSAILMNLESRTVAAEDMGKQFFTFGERKPTDHFLKMIDEVTAEDISQLAIKLMSSPPTMASYGAVHSLPNYDVIHNWFQVEILRLSLRYLDV